MNRIDCNMVTVFSYDRLRLKVCGGDLNGPIIRLKFESNRYRKRERDETIERKKKYIKDIKARIVRHPKSD